MYREQVTARHAKAELNQMVTQNPIDLAVHHSVQSQLEMLPLASASNRRVWINSGI